MRMYEAGEWIDNPATIRVVNPYAQTVIDTVPRAQRVVESAVRGSRAMAALSGHERFQILRKAANLIAARREELGRTITFTLRVPCGVGVALRPFNLPLNLGRLWRCASRTTR